MKKLLKKIYFFTFLFLAFAMFVSPVRLFAAPSTPPPPPTNPNPNPSPSVDPPTLEGGQLADIVDKVLEYLFPIAGIIALIFIIQGGYMWIISGGDPSKVKQAQGTLTWAILGLVIVAVVFGVLRILIDFLS
jgi:hypothetical protein